MKYGNLLISTCVFLYACSGHENTTSAQTKIVHDDSNSVHIRRDTVPLDSQLYSGKYLLREKTAGRFTYEIDENFKDSIVSIISKCKIANKGFEYRIFLKLKRRLNSLSDFNFNQDGTYSYIGSQIRIGQQVVDITNLTFANETTSKVFPCGPWHWSIDGAAIKYYKYCNFEYFIIYGANLFCNGSHCNSFQVYLVRLSTRNIDASALYFRSILPFSFDNIRLIDGDRNCTPEIYVTKNRADEVNTKNDFDLFELTSTGILVKK